MNPQQDNFEIKNFNFIVPIIADTGEQYKIFVPQPNEKELKGLAHILGFLFTKIRTENMDLTLFVKDWRIYAEEVCARLENGETKLLAMDTYIERSLLGAEAWTPEGDKVETLTPTEKEFFEGALVFMSALYRYSPLFLKEKELGEFFTSSTSSEFKNSLRKSPNTPSRGIGVSTRRSAPSPKA